MTNEVMTIIKVLKQTTYSIRLKKKATSNSASIRFFDMVIETRSLCRVPPPRGRNFVKYIILIRTTHEYMCGPFGPREREGEEKVQTHKLCKKKKYPKKV